MTDIFNTAADADVQAEEGGAKEGAWELFTG